MNVKTSLLSRFSSRLGARILAAMTAALALASAASLLLFLPLYSHELQVERQAVSISLGASLQIALENAMLKRDIDGLNTIVTRLGGIGGVANVRIADPSLEVRFASDPARLGERFASLAEICPDCALRPDAGGSAGGFVRDASGREILRSVTAVANHEPCTECHGPVAAKPVNGFLIVDSDATSLKQRARRTASMLSAAGIGVVLVALAVVWWALRRYVTRPVARLTSASRRLAAGDLSARAAVPATEAPRDEIEELSGTFDQMAVSLATTMTALQEREAFQQDLIDAIPDAIRVIGPDYQVIAANREFCRQTGLTHAEVLARPCYWSSHARSEPCVPTLVVCPLATLTDGERTVRCMHTHTRPATQDAYAVEVNASLFVQSQSPPRRYVVEALRDLSKDMSVSQEQRLSEIAQLATGVAHEIHNPLGAIRMGLGAIRTAIGTSPEAEEAKTYVDLVDTEIERCIEVTSRLMKLSRAPGEAGMLVAVGEAARDAVSLLAYEGRTRGIDLDVDIHPGCRVVANDGELGMIFVNLVQNAFHATASGGRVHVFAPAPADGRVVIEVVDTGVGIPRENLPMIFHPFWSWRADGSTGSGLGLSICKALLTKWQGTIEVFSEPGRGTRFVVTLPDADAAVSAP